MNFFCKDGTIMKQLGLILIILFLGRSAALFADSLPLEVGVIIPLTGPASSMGQSLEGVFRMSESPLVHYHLEDDQCDPKKSLAAYYKLSQEKIHVFYVACSGAIMAIDQHAKSNGDLIVTSYSGSTVVRSTGPEVIRFNPDALSLADSIADLFVSNPRYRGIKHVALLYEQQDYASSLASLLKERLKERLSSEESYLATQPSFKSQITRLAHSSAELVIYIPVGEGLAQVMLREMKELRFNKPILGEVNLCDYPFSLHDYSLAGDCLSARFTGEPYKIFQKKYRERVGRPSEYPFYDAITYDITTFFEKYRSAHSLIEVPSLIREILGGVHGEVSNYEFTPDGEVTNGVQYLWLKSSISG